MEENKTDSKKARIGVFWIIGILLLLFAILIASYFLFFNRNNANGSPDITPTKIIIIPTDEPLLTPTIIPSSKSGWKTFIYSDPKTQYSFNYPSTWGLVEINHNNIVRLNFAGHCRVQFSTPTNTGGNISPSTTQSETQTYAGRTFQVTTIEKNNKPYLETLSLSDATSTDGFSEVSVDIPPFNTSQCQQTVNQILSSLTFGQ